MNCIHLFSYGLLRRIHRLHIQFSLEAESDKTGIKYPTIEAHKKKDGCNSQQKEHTFPSNEEIVKAVEQAKERAQELVESLGMAKLLKEKKCWDFPPIPTVKEDELVDDDNENDDYDDVDDEKVDDIISGVLEESIVNNDPGDIVSGIDDLKKAGIIDSTLSSHLTTLQRAAFKRIPGTSLPTYDICVEPKKKNTKPKFSPFVEISRSGKSVFIHKTTAVWLLQEEERVSADRLFRVRAKQPFATEVKQCVSRLGVKPLVCSTINLGDICAFKLSDKEWKLGRVLQFSYFKEKTKKAKQYLKKKVSNYLRRRILASSVLGTHNLLLQPIQL